MSPDFWRAFRDVLSISPQPLHFLNNFTFCAKYCEVFIMYKMYKIANFVHFAVRYFVVSVTYRTYAASPYV